MARQVPPATIVARAASYIGQREVPPGSNSGPFVRLCQRATWLAGTGWPWCAAFVQLVFDEVGLPWSWKTAGAWDFYARGKAAGWAHATPEPGDVAIWNFGSGHASIVESFNAKTGVVTTIDGNWGDQVQRVEHPLAEARGFIRHPGLSRVAKVTAKAPLFQVVGSASGKRRVVFRGPRSKVGRWIAATPVGKRFPAGITIKRLP